MALEKIVFGFALGDLWGGFQKADLYSELDAVRKQGQFYDWIS